MDAIVADTAVIIGFRGSDADGGIENPVAAMILPVDRPAAGENHFLFLVSDFIAEKIRRRFGLLLEGSEIPFQFVRKNFYQRRLPMGRGPAKDGGK